MSLLSLKVHRADNTTLDLSDRVIQYTQRESLEGFPSFSLALPLALDGAPVIETFRIGDLLEAGFTHTQDGLSYAYRTTMVGVIQKIGQQQALTERGLTRVASVSGVGLAGFLAADSVNYWVATNLARVFKTAGEARLESLAMKRLDQALAAFMEQVAFDVLKIRRPQGDVRRLLAYCFRSLEGVGQYYLRWANFEGALWGFLDAYAEKPLHELYSLTLPLAEFERLEGVKPDPARLAAFGPDRAVAAVIHRPAPFPYATPDGKPTLGEWPRLPLHDLTPEHLEAGTDHSADWDVASVRNAFFLTPATFALDTTLQKAYIPVVVNVPKWERYGYRPLSWQTGLWGQDARGEGITEFFRALNWRVAAQHNRLEEYSGATLELRLAPWLQPGHRAKYRHYVGDDTAIFQGYITSVTHTWSPGPQGKRSTTVQLDRCTGEAIYTRDIGFFTFGLSEYNPLGDKDLPEAQVRARDGGPAKRPTGAGEQP